MKKKSQTHPYQPNISAASVQSYIQHIARLAHPYNPSGTDNRRIYDIAHQAQVDDTNDKDNPNRSDGIRRMIVFLTSRYLFRRNEVMKYVEYRANAAGSTYQPLDPCVQKRMTLEVQLQGIEVSIKDVRNFLESDFISAYDPIRRFLYQCDGAWDGRDHIGALAATVPNDNPHWQRWFRTWFLAMVQQWTQPANSTYGNSVAPLLISTQGYHKSTFCRRLLPPELRWGYTDNLVLTEKRQVMLAMSQQLLINLDEFNQISPKVQQGFLKNIIQLPNLKIKRPYGVRQEEMPRCASFIATSNMDDILADPSGNRRFIAIHLTAPINVDREPNYRQLYAQALAALRRGEPTWFGADDTALIMQNNRQFETVDPTEQYFRLRFVPAEDEEHGTWLTTTELFDQLRKQAGSPLKTASLTTFGRKLANMPDIQRRRFKTGTKYLVKRVADQ